MNLAITNYFFSVSLLSNALSSYYMLEFLEKACMYLTGFVVRKCRTTSEQFHQRPNFSYSFKVI